MTFNAPDIDYAGLSPVIALTGGLCIVLLLGLIPRLGRFTMAHLTLPVPRAPAGLSIWQWGENQALVAAALRLDAFGLAAALIACLAAAIAVLLSIREPAAEEAGHGAFSRLVLRSVR